MTARQFAAATGAAYTTVMLWLKQGLISGAELVESPVGAYWQIPTSAVESFQKPIRGRPKKADEAETIEASRKSAPVKATKKRAAKKAAR